MSGYSVINRDSMADGQPEDITVVRANFDAIATNLSNLQNAVGSATVFNVKHAYGGPGARGDGVNDDTVAIQNAINAAAAAGGGIVYFPSGIYRVTLQGTHAGLGWGLVIAADNITLLGDGPTSILRASGDVSVIFADGPSRPGGPTVWDDHWVHRCNIPAAHPLYAISAAAKGSKSVTLVTPANDSNFNIGDYVLIRTGQTLSTFNEQPDSEINRIVSKAAGVLTLERPLAKAYAAENFPAGHPQAGTPAPFGIQRFNVGSSMALIRNFAMRRLRIESTASVTYAPVTIDSVDGLTIEECEMESNYFGFTVSRTRDQRAFRNKVILTTSGDWQWAFSVDTSCTDAWFEDNVIQSAGSGYIHVHEGPARIKILNNIFLNQGRVGEGPCVDIRSRAYDVEVVGNQIINCGGVGAAITVDEFCPGGGIIRENSVFAPSLVGTMIGVGSSNWVVVGNKLKPHSVALGNPAAVPYIAPSNIRSDVVSYSVWVTPGNMSALIFNAPFYFLITSVSIFVNTAFNSSGTDLISVGTVEFGLDAFHALTDVSTTGAKTFAPGWAFGGVIEGTDLGIWATYAAGGSAPTTGKVLVVVTGTQVPYKPL